ncbi:hypothetical protein Gotri_023074 [Gossypium trilobum]|uniref:RNase H type-1 domain-containing protein n=1 Tax=Gossypium trilobum TaxID=34281 RepID=A0A7J9DHY5_9ROSI|nr:hypothetical protein [Gossypium trilobum]
MEAHDDMMVWREEPLGDTGLQCRIFCCSLWAIWIDRNKGLHEGKRSMGYGIEAWVIRYIKEMDECEIKKLTKESVNMEWCPLNESDIKMNFDAAFDVPQAKSVSAVVARNASREILVPKTVAHGEVASPFTVEAHACLQAVLLGKHMGYALVIIEGDMHQ